MKCPFCKSENCEVIDKLQEVHIFHQPVTPNITQSANDKFVEFICNDCGIITKVDPKIYKG